MSVKIPVEADTTKLTAQIGDSIRAAAKSNKVEVEAAKVGQRDQVNKIIDTQNARILASGNKIQALREAGYGDQIDALYDRATVNRVARPKTDDAFWMRRPAQAQPTPGQQMMQAAMSGDLGGMKSAAFGLARAHPGGAVVAAAMIGINLYAKWAQAKEILEGAEYRLKRITRGGGTTSQVVGAQFDVEMSKIESNAATMNSMKLGGLMWLTGKAQDDQRELTRLREAKSASLSLISAGNDARIAIAAANKGQYAGLLEKQAIEGKEMAANYRANFGPGMLESGAGYQQFLKGQEVERRAAARSETATLEGYGARYRAGVAAKNRMFETAGVESWIAGKRAEILNTAPAYQGQAYDAVRVEMEAKLAEYTPRGGGFATTASPFEVVGDPMKFRPQTEDYLAVQRALIDALNNLSNTLDKPMSN